MNPVCGWTDKYKDNWNDAYGRMMAWWNFEETDRPVVLTPVQKENAGGRAGGSGAAEETSDRTADGTACKAEIVTPEEKARLESDAGAHLARAREYNEGHIFTAESAPHAKTGYASLLGMLGACAGCAIRYEPSNLNAWFVKIPDLFEGELPEFRPEKLPYSFTIEMIDRYHAEFGMGCVLGANPLLDPMTTLAMMRGVEDFCADMYERPETVSTWIRRLGDIFLGIAAGYREKRAAFGRREEHNWTGAWAPGDMDAIQCDVSAYISPEMFRRFAMEEAEREAAFFDYSVWHLDGTGEFVHLPDILSIGNIRAIQWVDEKFRNPAEFSHIWKKVLKAGKGLLITAKLGEAVELTKRLGKRGLAFNLSDVKGYAEMEAALKKLRDIS